MENVEIALAQTKKSLYTISVYGGFSFIWGRGLTMTGKPCNVHKQLRTPQYRQRVVEDKKKKAKAKAYWADVDFYLVKYSYQMEDGFWSTGELEVMVKGFPNKDGHDEAERLAREMVGNVPMEIVSVTYI